ncbi:MAG TPA: hypothetical protein VGI39_16785 [Polyangiaceae bacterium]
MKREVLGLVLFLAVGLFVVEVALPIRPRPHVIRTTKTTAMELRRAAEMWRASHPNGGCPSLEQLKRDKAIDPASKVTDSWDTPFQIRCEAEETVVTSLGPDKRSSADDIVIPETERPRASSR